MNVGELTAAELSHRLRTTGLHLRTGPFVYRLKTTIGGIGKAIRLLYAEFPVAHETPFADFHVSLSPSRGIRRWLFPRATFRLGGYDTPPFGRFPLGVALPYLEWGLNWCIYNFAHNYLVIHAAVLERGGRALMILGTSGAGKSTLCAALAHNGWRLLSDELALLSPADGTIAPLARPISLKNESIQLIRNLAPDACFGPASTSTVKGTVAHMRPPGDSVRRVGERARPGWFVFTSYQAGAAVSLQQIDKAQAMFRIAQHTFNYSIWGFKGFEVLSRAVDSSHCYQLSYGELDEAIKLFNSAEFHGDTAGQTICQEPHGCYV